MMIAISLLTSPLTAATSEPAERSGLRLEVAPGQLPGYGVGVTESAGVPATAPAITMHLPGTWTTPAFNAGDFTANGSMVWTVDSVQTFAYTLNYKVMTVVFALGHTSVGGTPSNRLQVLVPGGKIVSKQAINPFIAYHNAPAFVIGACIAIAGSRILSLLHPTGNWAASARNTSVFGQITFEVD